MSDFEKLRGSFLDPKLLDKALTHRSWVNENDPERGTNERLEFLGDAILEFVVSDHIFAEFEEKEEGFLTALRANIVNTENLSKVARKLKVGEELHLSKGEEQVGGRDRISILADTVEAIIGAIYLDRGFDDASLFIHEYLLHDIDEKLAKPLKDPKSRLQESVQSRGLNTPKYKVKNEEGPDHNKVFEVQVLIDGDVVATGQGRSKSKAEQAAATLALEKFPISS